MFRTIVKFVIIFFAIFGVSTALSACSSTPETPSAQQAAVQDVPQAPAATSVDGEWNFSDGDFGMTAVIKGGEIKIVMKSGDTSGLYWAGTAPTAPLEDGDKFVSNGDDVALGASLFGSSDSEKEFEYKDGFISYPFTMMGVTKTIQLQK